jgi:GTP cyclohydrolase I
VVDHCARKLQVQETLTDEIVRTLERDLRPRGVGVVIRATHFCMHLRGVNHPGQMTTTALKGCVHDDPELRREFLALAPGAAGR